MSLLCEQRPSAPQQTMARLDRVVSVASGVGGSINHKNVA
jgi:hypothetical protein